MQYLGPVYDDVWSEDEVVYPGGQGQEWVEIMVTAGNTGNYTFVAVGTSRLVIDYNEYPGSAVIGMVSNEQVSVILYHDGSTNLPQYVSVMVVPEGGSGSRQEYNVRVDFSIGIDGSAYGAPESVYGTTNTPGGDVTLQIPRTTPYRYDGYTFAYWTDGYNAYYPGGTITVAASNMLNGTASYTLSAEWTTSGGGGGGDNPGTGGGDTPGGGGNGKEYIHNGTSCIAASLYIHNGTSWVKTTPYIYDGGWK